MPRILILQLKRIGDAVLTAPALAALRAVAPDSHLTLILAGAAGQLGPVFTMVDDVRVYRRRSLNAAFWKHIVSTRWDAVLDFTGTDRSALISILSRAPRRAGYAKFDRSWLHRKAWPSQCRASVRDLHTIDFHQALVRELFPCAPPVPDDGHLAPPPVMPPETGADRFVVVHPGTARPDKFWPASCWKEVIEHLQRQHRLPVVLTGGAEPFEQRHLNDIKAEFNAGTGPADLSGKIDLLQLGALLSRARLVISVDTGAMHLAAAFERPQIALFGPTNPFHWAPRHSRARVLLAGVESDAPFTPRHKAAEMSAIAASDVKAAADDLLRLPVE